MTDERLRALERAYRESGDPESHARLIVALMRAGRLSEWRVRVAAKAMSEGAALALDRPRPAWGMDWQDIMSEIANDPGSTIERHMVHAWISRALLGYERAFKDSWFLRSLRLLIVEYAERDLKPRLDTLSPLQHGGPSELATLRHRLHWVFSGGTTDYLSQRAQAVGRWLDRDAYALPVQNEGVCLNTRRPEISRFQCRMKREAEVKLALEATLPELCSDMLTGKTPQEILEGGHLRWAPFRTTDNVTDAVTPGFVYPDYG